MRKIFFRFNQYLSILPTNLKTRYFLCIGMLLILSLMEVLNISLVVPLGSKIASGKLPNFIENINFLKNIYSNIPLTIFLIFLLYCLKLLFATLILKFIATTIFLSKTFLQKLVVWNHINLNYSDHIKKNFSQFINDCHLNTIIFTDSFVQQVIIFFSELCILFFIVTILLFNNFNFFSSIFLAIFIIIILNKNYLQKSLYKIGKFRDDADTKLTSIFKDIFNIFRYIKLNSGEKTVIENMENYVQTANFYYSERFKRQQLIKYLTEFLSVTILLFMIFTLTYFEQKDYLQSLILGMVLFIRLVPTKNRLLSSIQSLNFSRKVVDRTMDGFIESKIASEKTYGFEIGEDFGKVTSLQVKKLDFSYDEIKGPQILSNINLNVSKGDKILIMGASGSGKSTLIDIISGLLKPVKGEVIVNDKNIKLNYKSFLSKISYVSQSSYFIDDTIKKNLELFQKNNSTNEKINKILQITEAEKFVNNLSEKLNTKINMNAQQLSGGEKQRLALSRALLKNFDVLILDEATNALDEETETKVVNNIIQSFKDKIIIFISHNPNFKKIADKVFDINDRKLKKLI